MQIIHPITQSDITKLAKEVESFRKKMDLKQEDFADILGVSRITYVRKERGETQFSFLDIYMLAKTFGVQISTITPSFGR